MTISDEDKLEISCRKLILGFYSAEINNHGRLFIGFSALMFTVLSLRDSILDHTQASIMWQVPMLYVFVFAVGSALFYVLFRTIGYGTLSNATIHGASIKPLKQKNDSSQVYPLLYDITEYVKKCDNKILSKLPIEYFMSLGGGKQRWGCLICVVLSAISTSLLYLLLEL